VILKELILAKPWAAISQISTDCALVLLEVLLEPSKYGVKCGLVLILV
jgi:hypothetical protein